MKVSIPITIAVLITISILILSKHVSKIGVAWSSNSFINYQINYQLLLLAFALLSAFCAYLLNAESLRTTLSFGNLFAKAEPVEFFGIKEGDSWMKTGISLSIFITLVTGGFMYFQLKGTPIDYSLLKTGIFWIVLFSITNAFSEELIYRVGINAPLHGLLTPKTIFLISATIFGIAHIQGMPNGIIGVVLAGLLGYILSKSVYETNGLFWAWFIHFLQDVVIIGALYLINSK